MSKPSQRSRKAFRSPLRSATFVASLLRDANTRHSDETAVLTADPFLAEIAAYTSQLNELQRSIFLNHVRELAAGRRRTA